MTILEMQKEIERSMFWSNPWTDKQIEHRERLRKHIQDMIGTKDDAQ